ncbi:NAD(P)-dependent oxidoreductase [Bacillus sp. NEB1478]|uniref:NAD(P)-dependent oxidoreductase n=1 Tax=Bacillus sp. NEB1478 TaxID=3073816 RepID=UPI00287309F7|nr:NAD(P)-dependent oxidoreductase [Bacillus sp. NEB1478]WNB92222.1 NAD(P)-dependent oxidoreductase [Bacillus sp. NEB1478]
MVLQTIGFIGTGVMGKSMAGHLMKAGYPLYVYTRTKEKADELIDQGAKWASSPAEIAQNADIIITMVGYPSDVEHVYLSEEGLVAHAKPGSFLIDMTTSSPQLAQKIAAAAAEKDVQAFDAPVSGGDIGAKEARLSIMVGGDQPAFEELKTVFSLMGSNVVYQGKAGSGQHTKMCNQIAIASGMIGVCEAILYAEKAGLDPETVLKSIESGAAGSWSLSNLAPRMLKGDFAPGFYVKHFIKDMTIALNSAEEMGLVTPGLSLTKKLYEELAEMGEENSGTHALYKRLKNQG